jgi:hypothetical protein
VQHGAFDSTFEDYQFITISVECLIQGLFCAGAGMITFGALLGKASPSQLVLILLMEVPIYAVNAEYLVGGLFGKMGAQVCSPSSCDDPTVRLCYELGRLLQSSSLK